MSSDNQWHVERNRQIIAKHPEIKQYFGSPAPEFQYEFAVRTKSNKGIFPRQIFEEAGLSIDILGKKRIEMSAFKWREIYKKRGSLEDTRKVNSGRPLERELSLEDKIARLEAKNKLLESENELLKKAELIERGLIFKIKD